MAPIRGIYKKVGFRFTQPNLPGWAFTSINCSPWARAYYDYHKERDQSHGTILRNLGKKWTKILFAVWSQGTSYDETLHIKNLKAKNIPWAMAL
jgi:hypothetical protein